jgi:hypothetical protein
MSDRKDFSDLLDRLGEMYDKSVSVALKRAYWEALEPVDIEALRQAVRAHQRDIDRGRFFPKPADLLAKLPGLAACGAPSADEAWAIALVSYDEQASVVWTAQIAQARELARPIWEAGDKVGARMAFKGAYERAIAGREQDAPRWELSAGGDAVQRAAAVRQAEAAGILSAQRARQLLPALSEPEADVKAVAALLTGKDARKVLQGPWSDKAHLRRFREAVQAGMQQAAKKGDDEAVRRREAAVRRRQQVEAEKARITQVMREQGVSDAV